MPVVDDVAVIHTAAPELSIRELWHHLDADRTAVRHADWSVTLRGDAEDIPDGLEVTGLRAVRCGDHTMIYGYMRRRPGLAATYTKYLGDLVCAFWTADGDLTVTVRSAGGESEPRLTDIVVSPLPEYRRRVLSILLSGPDSRDTDDIASLLGVSRMHAIRLLRALKRDGRATEVSPGQWEASL